MVNGISLFSNKKYPFVDRFLLTLLLLHIQRRFGVTVAKRSRHVRGFTVSNPDKVWYVLSLLKYLSQSHLYKFKHNISWQYISYMQDFRIQNFVWRQFNQWSHRFPEVVKRLSRSHTHQAYVHRQKPNRRTVFFRKTNQLKILWMNFLDVRTSSAFASRMSRHNSHYRLITG